MDFRNTQLRGQRVCNGAAVARQQGYPRDTQIAQLCDHSSRFWPKRSRAPIDTQDFAITGYQQGVWPACVELSKCGDRRFGERNALFLKQPACANDDGAATDSRGHPSPWVRLELFDWVQAANRAFSLRQ